MSPFFPEVPYNYNSQREKPPPKINWQEIIKNWKERLPEIKKTSPLVTSVLQSTLEKIEKAQEYNNPQTKNNVLQNAYFFLSILGLYISSPSFSQKPPQSMEELIEGLNSFNPEPPFLKPGDTFTDCYGRKFKISKIYPPNILPNELNGSFLSGVNQWDSPPPNRLVPGNYILEKISE